MKNILLVEDDPFLIDIYSMKLQEAGFSVEVVKDGADALEKAMEKKFDLVLLDLVLPNIDGWEILAGMRKEKKLDGLKIIILSNLGQKEEIEKGLKMGANKYLIKDHFTPSEVIKEIRQVLE